MGWCILARCALVSKPGEVVPLGGVTPVVLEISTTADDTKDDEIFGPDVEQPPPEAPAWAGAMWWGLDGMARVDYIVAPSLPRQWHAQLKQSWQ